MLERLKQEVCQANLELVNQGLVIYTFGNVSAIDRSQGLVCIKPSGVEYQEMKPEDMVILDLEGNKVEGKLNPSSDTKTHIMLYKGFPQIGAVAHTHSVFATSWAQAQKSIPCLGTTHADYFYGGVPCTPAMSDQQIQKDYEQETGTLILETFKPLDYRVCQGVLVASHGPFTWGKDAAQAVYMSTMLEWVARSSLYTLMLDPEHKNISKALLDKHYLRKHGREAYYGQQ
jgi:L-ribulose-5-phosphate 4-epimerase